MLGNSKWTQLPVRACVARSVLMAVLGSAAAISATPAAAAGTPAGTQIDNTASATYDLPGGGSGRVDSNTVSLRVDELLDVSVAWSDGGDVAVQPGLANQVLTFQVTNGGNGSEAFRLSARNSLSGDDFDPASYAIHLDSNADGDYDPGIDLPYVAGTNDPVLAPDASATVFLVSSIPASATDAQRAGLDLIAAAVTGSGAPGTSLVGQGDGGGDAVIGATGADAEDEGYYRVSAATVAFIKSATIKDPFGGTTSVPGSTITYRLVATVSGSGSLANLAVSDSIPGGTIYATGSLTLEGAALSDALDSDAGESSGTGVVVRLGDVAAGTTRTVTFKVVIQ